VLHLRGIRPHERCRLVIVARNATREIAARWRANYEGHADVSGTTAVPIQAIASLEVIAGRHTTLLSIPVRA
jgi:hypothetical protein